MERYSDETCEAVMIHIEKAKLLISAIYRPPLASETSFKGCISKVQSFTEKKTDCDHIMMGDFNFRFVKWSTETLLSDGISLSEMNQARHFINYTNRNLLTQLVEEPTRKDSMLDLVLTTNTDIIHNIEIEKLMFRL